MAYYKNPTDMHEKRAESNKKKLMPSMLNIKMLKNAATPKKHKIIIENHNTIIIKKKKKKKKLNKMKEKHGD
jgi:hypothetical protein